MNTVGSSMRHYLNGFPNIVCSRPNHCSPRHNHTTVTQEIDEDVGTVTIIVFS